MSDADVLVVGAGAAGLAADGPASTVEGALASGRRAAAAAEEALGG